MTDKKKRGFLDYGKEDDREEKSSDRDDEDKDDADADEGASQKRIMYLAEQTGVDNPKALIKLIKACKSG